MFVLDRSVTACSWNLSPAYAPLSYEVARQHAPKRFAEVRGLEILYFCCFYVFLRVFPDLFYVSFCFLFMFSPSIFKLLHLQSKKHI